MRWEFTGTNVFNSPNYSNPGLNITSAGGVGVLTDVGGSSDLDPSGSRGFRTGLRIEF